VLQSREVCVVFLKTPLVLLLPIRPPSLMAAMSGCHCNFEALFTVKSFAGIAKLTGNKYTAEVR